jgi:ABC-2 type transport system ATP-binding protein
MSRRLDGGEEAQAPASPGPGGKSGASPLEARGLGKRFRREWGLRDCTLELPRGAIVGLAGPNAAGKSTLLALATGLQTPTEGTISVLGRDPLRDPAVLAEVGFVAQGAPLYRSFTVADTIEFARRTNARFDAAIASELLPPLGSRTKVGNLSAGDRARLALAIVLGKRPQLLLLDEPFAGLDPLAGREFLQLLMDGVAETSATVVIASHVIADIERVCDHIVLLAGGGVRLQGNVEALLDSHRILMGPRRPLGSIRGVREIVRERHSGRQLTLLVTTDGPVVDPSWTVDQVALEELLLAYMAPERLPTPQPPERVPLRWHG